MRLYPLFFLMILMCLGHTATRAQQIDSMMNVYAESFPKEKIHLHFDKSAYNKEETI